MHKSMDVALSRRIHRKCASKLGYKHCWRNALISLPYMPEGSRYQEGAMLLLTGKTEDGLERWFPTDHAWNNDEDDIADVTTIMHDESDEVLASKYRYVPLLTVTREMLVIGGMLTVKGVPTSKSAGEVLLNKDFWRLNYGEAWQDQQRAYMHKKQAMYGILVARFNAGTLPEY